MYMYSMIYISTDTLLEQVLYKVDGRKNKGASWQKARREEDGKVSCPLHSKPGVQILVRIINTYVQSFSTISNLYKNRQPFNDWGWGGLLQLRRFIDQVSQQSQVSHKSHEPSLFYLRTKVPPL